MKKSNIIIIILIIGIIVLCAFLFIKNKFQNVEIELNNNVNISDFIAFGNLNGIDVDLSNVNTNVVGDYQVSIKYLLFKINRLVKVVDKKPPLLEVQNLSKTLNYQPNVNDFIINVSDQSKYTVMIENNVDTSRYGEYSVIIVAKDISGNVSKKEAKLNITWAKEEYRVEVGNIIEARDLVYDENDANTILESDLDRINNDREGTYYIESKKDNIKANIKIVKVKDNTPPTLELKNLTIYYGKKIKDVKDFVTSAKDKGSDVNLRIVSSIDYEIIGKQTVKIEASDLDGNKIVKEAILEIIKDNIGPKISGLTKIVTRKNTKIDYRAGVTAYDDNTGDCQFNYDDSGVDLLNDGLYYVFYTSSDSLGNKTTERRVVEVKHDNNDISDSIRNIANTLPNDVEKIRDYVRNKIDYNTNWGGDDPIWYGLTNKTGNCFVHAMIFDALLQAKGYTTKVIWTTDKTHYWNMVLLNGKWVHMDSTPGPSHSKYSFMNDKQRFERLNLNGKSRDWDRSLWPKVD